MKVKLTRWEPTDEMQTKADGAVAKLDPDAPISEAAWQAAHDAAPDDATKALVALVRACDEHTREQDEDTLQTLRTKLEAFRATPEGAALIRQAAERDDGTLP